MPNKTKLNLDELSVQSFITGKEAFLNGGRRPSSDNSEGHEQDGCSWGTCGANCDVVGSEAC